MQLEMFDTGSAGDEVGGSDLEKKKELCKKAGGEWLSDDPSGKYGHCSKPIEEADGESAPFGSGMERADLDPEEEELIGHTWLTHGKLKTSALQEAYGIPGGKIGKIKWHSLDKNGVIGHYDIAFGKKTLKNVPASLVESAVQKEHKHEAREPQDSE